MDKGSAIAINHWRKKSLLGSTLPCTSNERAEEAVPRLLGSTERRVCRRFTVDAWKSLNVSRRELSYGCCGLNNVAWGSLVFFQYSSGGEPQSLKILCNCSTCMCNSWIQNRFKRTVKKNSSCHFQLISLLSISWLTINLCKIDSTLHSTNVIHN